jgi:hypothetical protein
MSRGLVEIMSVTSATLSCLEPPDAPPPSSATDPAPRATSATIRLIALESLNALELDGYLVVHALEDPDADGECGRAVDQGLRCQGR